MGGGGQEVKVDRRWADVKMEPSTFFNTTIRQMDVDKGDLNVLAFGGFSLLVKGGKQPPFSHLPSRQWKKERERAGVSHTCTPTHEQHTSPRED